MDDRQVCEQFLRDPARNPRTGRVIKLGATIYNQLVHLCEQYGYSVSGQTSAPAFVMPSFGQVQTSAPAFAMPSFGQVQTSAPAFVMPRFGQVPVSTPQPLFFPQTRRVDLPTLAPVVQPTPVPTLAPMP